LSKKTNESSVKPAPPAPTPAPPQPTAIDTVNKAIAEVQADPEFKHYSVEHLEVAAIRKLVEWGWGEERAREGVQDRLYNS
jgi:hypothetical protein